MTNESKGFNSTLEMLRGLEPEHQIRLLKDVAEKDPELAEKLKSNLFQFEDLALISQTSLTELLKSVAEKTLALSLRKCSETVYNAIFSSMSSRAGDMLRDTIQALGPQPLSKVTQAQKEMLEKAVELEKSGKISLSRSNSEELV